MTALQTINAFIYGTPAKSSNLISDGEKLWSYNTVIAQYINGNIVVNVTKYSCTTTKRQNQVLRAACNARTVEGVPMNTFSLVSYL